ncbi:oxidoreductase [Streptomyces sp. NPDC049585]|uniref:oxidoreductase n=1 Tax=Streptomyces sp. NPDC049585 TaxID=3155154 RepID=UPI00343F12A9
MLTYEELTAPERELWNAFPEGRPVDLRAGATGAGRAADRADGGAQWGPERTVRAAVVAALLLGANTDGSGAVPAVRLSGARITGQLYLAGAQIDHLLGLDDCWLEREVDLFGASTAVVAMRGCRIPGLMAGSARIQGRLDLQRSLLDGGPLSRLRGRVTSLQLNHAHVHGEVLLNGTHIDAPGGLAVAAGGLVAEGGVFCRNGFTAHGEVRLLGARLSGGLFLQGAHLANPGGSALTADMMTTTTLDCSQGFTALGAMSLRGVRVSDLLTFDGATLDAVDTVVCARMHAEDLAFTPATPPAGTVDLRGAQVTTLRDGEDSWPQDVRLDGLVYGSVDAGSGRPDDVRRRLAWIRRNPGYVPQVYEQLARWYRQIGHDDHARRVLVAKQRHRRRTLHPGGRVWSRILDVTVGYGYRPWKAGLWLAALTLLGAIVFGTHTPAPVKPGEGGPFHAVVYTVDLLVPIGGLGQRNAWYWTDGTCRWLANALVAAGWILTTAVVSGVTRTLSRS